MILPALSENRMKRVFLYITIFILLLVKPGFAQPFSVGEKLVYKIYASGFTVGYQTIQVEDLVRYNGKYVWVLKGRSKTSPFVSIFYKLDDKWIIYMDRDSLLPIRVEKEIVEGNRRGYLIYEIDQDNKSVLIKNIKGKKVKRLSFKNELFDLFSLIYFFRSNPEKFGDEFIFDFLEEKAVRTVKFKREKDIMIKVPAISRKSLIHASSITQVGGIGIRIIVGLDSLKLPIKMIVPSKLPGNRKLNVIFTIKSYTPGKDRHKIPGIYRKIVK